MGISGRNAEEGEGMWPPRAGTRATPGDGGCRMSCRLTAGQRGRCIKKLKSYSRGPSGTGVKITIIAYYYYIAYLLVIAYRQDRRC